VNDLGVERAYQRVKIAELHPSKYLCTVCTFASGLMAGHRCMLVTTPADYRASFPAEPETSDISLAHHHLRNSSSAHQVELMHELKLVKTPIVKGRTKGQTFAWSPVGKRVGILHAL
jgi:hypothetical protein